MTVKKAKCKIVNGLINHISFVAFSLSVLHSSYLVPSPLRWFISQPHFPTWCWSSCSSEEWPSPAPLTASSILSHQSGRSWTMQRYPTPAGLIQPTMCFAPFIRPVFSFFFFFTCNLFLSSGVERRSHSDLLLSVGCLGRPHHSLLLQ